MNDARLLRRFRQIEQDAYRRGFEAAKAAALEAARSVVASALVSGETIVTTGAILDAIDQLTPEVTR